MNVRGSVPTKISCSRNSGDRRKLHSPFSWFAQSFEILAKFTASFSNYLAYCIGWVFLCKNSKKHGKFTVAELHNKFRAMPCRCCQEDTARSAANTYKDMQRRLGVVQRSRVRFRRAGKLVESSHVTRGKGWGKEKRSQRLKGTYFSLTSFSSVNGTI